MVQKPDVIRELQKNIREHLKENAVNNVLIYGVSQVTVPTFRVFSPSLRQKRPPRETRSHFSYSEYLSLLSSTAFTAQRSSCESYLIWSTCLMGAQVGIHQLCPVPILCISSPIKQIIHLSRISSHPGNF